MFLNEYYLLLIKLYFILSSSWDRLPRGLDVCDWVQWSGNGATFVSFLYHFLWFMVPCLWLDSCLWGCSIWYSWPFSSIYLSVRRVGD